MYRKVIVIISALALSAVCAFGQMSDAAVREYLMQGMSAGKTVQQLSSELLSRGVTTSQANRLMREFKGKNADSSLEVGQERQRTVTATDVRREHSADKQVKKEEERPVRKEIDTEEETSPEDTIVIYGHDIFDNKNLSFEPNANVATPRDYVLGPSDELIIDVWGVNEATIKQTISPEGNIIISQVGPLTLSGLTIDQAENKIRKALSSKYSLNGPNPESQMSLTLGKVRTIQVHVMGEVKTPGTYRLSSLSSVFNALYFAGGVSDIGSVRNIKVSRNGNIVSSVDLYSMIFDGTKAGNITLRDDDIIIVPAYYALVETEGGFKRPMYYELLPDDNVADVVKYTGGFLSGSYDKEVLLMHRDGTKGDVTSVPAGDFDKVSVKDGDVITAYDNNQRVLYSNIVKVDGCVVRPGSYELGGDVATVRQLIERAGGLLEEAYRDRAQLVREMPDRRAEIKSVALGAILDGKAEDILLRSNDILIVSDRLEIEPLGDIEITGYVREPGKFQYYEGISVQDLIMLSGGLADGASLVNVEVSRRIVDPKSRESAETLASVFTFDMENGLAVGGEPEFTLMPYDIVSVRKSPAFVEQKQVLVSGEVTFPGAYTLLTSNERISSLFKRAGGSTANAYIAGATLKRKMTEDERNVRDNMTNLMKNGGNGRDTTMLGKLSIDEVYTIGISLDKALAAPGSSDDLILLDGDELIVPSLTNTVRIQGQVMYPNAVNFIPGKGVDYYVHQAGGYGNEAKRAKVYVLHMNGTISVGRGATIYAGDEIVVPIRPERQKTSVGEWIGIGSAAASITTMVATIVSLMKR